MKPNEVIIAIDPDATKSGVCELYSQTEFRLHSLEFPKLIDHIQMIHSDFSFTPVKLIVLVEAGWLNQSNWHVKSSDNRRVASAKGNAVGRNHETGRKIIEMLRHYGIEVQEVRPLKKCWKGKEGKITHEELAYFVPGLPSRTSQDVRDSLLLAWNYACFPIRVPPIQSRKSVKNLK